MDTYEGSAKLNIAETCAASISMDDLSVFANEKPEKMISFGRKLLYGDIRGSDRLRSNIASLYAQMDASAALTKENVLITSGAISANFLALYSLVGRGNHVICHHPTYQQLYSVPASLGAEVDLWRTRPDRSWELDVEELKGLIRPNTRLIIIKYLHSRLRNPCFIIH